MHIKCFDKCRKPNPIFTNNTEKVVLNLLQLKGINDFDKIFVTNIITILINIIRLKRIVKKRFGDPWFRICRKDSSKYFCQDCCETEN